MKETENGQEIISGTVERILYANEENGYTVAEMITDGDDDVTVSGIMPFLSRGEKINCAGKWTVHPTYGPQFSVESYEKTVPTTEGDIKKYLSSGAISGIGPKTAERLVDRFGVDTFEVIEKHPEWLTDIKGITTERASKISESFLENFGMRTLLMFVRGFMGPQNAMKIYKKWGSAAVDLIKSDPYSVCTLDGISFSTADSIAKSLNLPPDFPGRVSAGIINFLTESSLQGHTFLPVELCDKGAGRMLDVGESIVSSVRKDLEKEGRLVNVKFDGRETVFLSEMFSAEKYVAKKLAFTDKTCASISREDISLYLKQLETEFDITYAKKQAEAIFCALSSGVFILTGGPGTGKTTVIRAILSVFERIGMKVVLTAPTGRAAKRLSEATVHEAKTIHRLLEADYTDGGFRKFRRGENDTLDEDVVIVDESSMIDIELAKALLLALKPGARIVFSGDIDQLPSVGAGSFLRDMIGSGLFKTVELSEIFRQAKASLIVENAHKINDGIDPVLDCKTSDFFFIPCDGEELTAKTVADLCSRRLPKAYGENICEKIQVIAPQHNGGAGTVYLNKLLQSFLNPKAAGKREYSKKSTVYRVGDKVMQLKNNYDIEWEKDGETGQGVFNGDIGKITNISYADETLSVDFDGRITVYPFSSLDELDLAYAITVHKSQGCEFPIVIVAVCGVFDRMMTRNLLYTAVTRAREMVIIVGRENDIKKAVRNNRQSVRYTALPLFLKSESEA